MAVVRGFDTEETTDTPVGGGPVFATEEAVVGGVEVFTMDGGGDDDDNGEGEAAAGTDGDDDEVGGGWDTAAGVGAEDALALALTAFVADDDATGAAVPLT